ncbi:serine/threonine protein kinase [Frankia sp. AgPm24]|uniref:WD40 repeat domain-containing serine/threonine protein kinase n=1 Tax=Frankia sp. AgPm24 TaxID=631128 RepID=UPI00200F2D37|nr:serine/threonine-protein kinase [Frankia sp. AgPm24]MCK9925458.1 serine/threonine protein kinase [Frankia sp. AgPm24]
MILNEAQLAAALPAYDLGPHLGRGAFGVVLAGRHRELGRDVAVKVLPIRQTGTSEARLLALLDHPHIVRVFDAVTVDDLHLIVMELLPGGTLTRRAAGITTEATCAVGLAVADALECAHRNGVLHRDIKPENILFDRSGLLKVTDFGIAKMVEGAAADASASAVVGTPRYMAPEQLLAGRLSAATDLYSLGTMLYELFSGRPPYGAGLSAPSLIAHHLNVPAPPPDGVPARISQVLMRALAKEPAARQPSAHAFALELAQAAATELGPGWLARSRIPARLDDDIRAAADSHPHPTASETPTADVTPAPHAFQGAHATPGAPPTPTPRPAPDAGGSAGPGSGGSPLAGLRHPSRPVAAAIVIALLAGIGTLLTITLNDGDDSDDAAGTHVATAGPQSPPSGASPSTSTTDRPPAPPGTRNAPRLLGSPLTAHTAALWTARFSPNGRLMATAGDDQVVLLWDVSDPAAPRDLGTRAITHPGRVEEVAFAPDGRTLAVGGDRTLRLWDISEPTAPRAIGQPLSGHLGYVYSIAFSPDGRRLASGGGNDSLVLWDVSDRTRPVLLTRYDGSTAAVAFAPDGRSLASGNGPRVLLWDASTPNNASPLAELPSAAAAYVYGLAYSPDGRVLATAGDARTVQLWDVTNRATPRPLGPPLTDHTATVVSVAFAPDGRTMATASDDHTVLLWDVTNPAAPSRLGEPLTSPGFISVDFSPDGHTLVTAGGDHLVRLWSVG